MAGTSALIAALVTPNVFAAPCSAGREDFINYVTGGNECLALDVFRGEALKKPGAHLVINVHGDKNGDRLVSSVSGSGRPLTDNIPENSKEIAAIQIIRPAYRTSYNNTTGAYPFPYEAEKTALRNSTGRVQSGSDSYTKENIEAVMHAAARLKEHYKPKMLTMTGQSGGAAIILSGSALFPQYAPDALILTGTPCNLEKLDATPPRPSSISPDAVIHRMPKGIKIVAFNGENDEKAPPSNMQACVDTLKKVGADVTFLQPYSTHGSTPLTPEYRSVLMAVLESVPPTIVATKPSSASPALISTSLSVPAQ